MEKGWLDVGEILRAEGHLPLAAHVQRFVEQRPQSQTDREGDPMTRQRGTDREFGSSAYLSR